MKEVCGEGSGVGEGRGGGREVTVTMGAARGSKKGRVGVQPHNTSCPTAPGSPPSNIRTHEPVGVVGKCVCVVGRVRVVGKCECPMSQSPKHGEKRHAASQSISRQSHAMPCIIE